MCLPTASHTHSVFGPAKCPCQGDHVCPPLWLSSLLWGVRRRSALQGSDSRLMEDHRFWTSLRARSVAPINTHVVNSEVPLGTMVLGLSMSSSDPQPSHLFHVRNSTRLLARAPGPGPEVPSRSRPGESANAPWR